MRKITSLLLAAAMTLGAATSAFAASVTPQISATKVAAGEDVTVTINLDEAMDNITMYQYSLYFDADLFTLKSSANGTGTVSELKTDSNGSYYSISYVDPTSEGQTIAAGPMATPAKADLTDEQTGEFDLVKSYVWDDNYAETNDAAVENGDVDVIITEESSTPDDTSKPNKPSDSNKNESSKTDSNKGSSSDSSSSGSSSSHDWGAPLNNSANADKDAADADRAPSADNNNANPGTGR